MDVFHALEEWEGHVDEIHANMFVGIVREVGGNVESERLEMPLSALDGDSRRLLVEGAVFRWTVGYFARHGVRDHASRFHVRRLPSLSCSERQEARDLSRAFQSLDSE